MLIENANKINDLANKYDAKTSESYIYNMLEFNDDFHVAEINERKSFYKSLIETKYEIVNEVNRKTIYDKLSELIKIVIDFIKKFIEAITKKDLKIRMQYKRLVVSSNGFAIQDKELERYVFTIHHFPNFNDIDDTKCRTAISNIVDDLNKICDGEDVPATDESGLMDAYKDLAIVCKQNASRKMFNDPINSSSSFSKFVRSDIIYNERKEMTYKEWSNSIKDITPTKKDLIIKKASGIKSDLESCEKRFQNANLIDENSIKNAKQLISQIKAIVSSWIWYLNSVYDAESMALSYIINTYSRIKNIGSSNESGLIHGEPFNSDTLFDNEDLRDFNPTEWMDLELTTEGFNFKYEMDEFGRVMSIKEALIFSDDEFNKFNRLKVMREAETKNFKETIDAIIKAIKEIINKFFEKLKNTLNLNKVYIKKYDNIIKENPFEQSTPECTSTGNILAGIVRINAPFQQEPFNYDLMKEDLKDKNIFFEKRVLPKLNASSNYSKIKSEWKNGETTITDYCKSYFGASIPEASCKFTGAELDAMKNNIIEFITESKSVISNIKAQINSLEAESKKVTSKLARTQNTKETIDKTENKNSDNEKDTSAKSESMYYSSLYDRYLTEIEITSGKPLNNENNQNENLSNNESSAFRVYYNVYKDVLMSRLTAAEFIISELMKIIHHHVEYYSKKNNKKNRDSGLF